MATTSTNPAMAGCLAENTPTKKNTTFDGKSSESVTSEGSDVRVDAVEGKNDPPLPRFVSMATIYNLDSVMSEADRTDSAAFWDPDVPIHELLNRNSQSLGSELEYGSSRYGSIATEGLDGNDEPENTSQEVFGRTQSTVFWLSDAPVEELLENHRQAKKELDASCEQSSQTIKHSELQVLEESDEDVYEEGKVIDGHLPDEAEVPIFRSGWGQVQLYGHPPQKTRAGWGEWQGLPRSADDTTLAREKMPAPVNGEVERSNQEKAIGDGTATDLGIDHEVPHSFTGVYVREHVRRAFGRMHCLALRKRVIP